MKLKSPSGLVLNSQFICAAVVGGLLLSSSWSTCTAVLWKFLLKNTLDRKKVQQFLLKIIMLGFFSFFLSTTLHCEPTTKMFLFLHIPAPLHKSWNYPELLMKPNLTSRGVWCKAEL